MSDLPAGWEVRHSSSRNLPYYYHPATGTTQWEPPTAGKKVHAYHLLVKHAGSRRPSSWRSPTITRTLAEAISLIEEYEEAIRKHDQPFEHFKQLASEFSDCSSAQKHGDLGEFGPGQMQPAFEKATMALRPGQMSGPVESDSGVHLIWRVK